MAAESLKKRAVRGTVITLGANVLKNLLRLGSNLLLTRLLFPEAFGVMALVNMLLMGLTMVSDLGIHTSIVQNERGDDDDFLATGFTLQVARGAVLWGVGAALALPLARFYDKPELLTLIPVATATAMFQGLESTRLPRLYRKMELGRIAALELGSQVVGAAVMVALAFVLASVWALVIGGLAQAASLCVASYFVLDGRRERFGWDPDSARALMTFGSWIFVSTLVTFLSLRLDVMLLGKLVPLSMHGVYSIGTMLAGLPLQVSGGVFGAVLLPALSESFREDPKVLQANFRSAQRALVPIGMFMSLGPVLLGPAFFYYLYDDRYLDAGWIVQLAMVAVWFRFLNEAWTQAQLAVGDSRFMAIANIVRLVFTAAGAIVGFRAQGMVGFLLGLGVGAFAGYLVALFNLSRHGLKAAAVDLQYTALGLALGFIGARSPGWLVDSPGLEQRALISAGVGLAILIPLGIFVARRTLRQVRGPA